MVPSAKPALGETVVEAVGTLAAPAPTSAVSRSSEVSPTVRENEPFPDLPLPPSQAIEPSAVFIAELATQKQEQRQSVMREQPVR
jgi:hypothetical protein